MSWEYYSYYILDLERESWSQNWKDQKTLPAIGNVSSSMCEKSVQTSQLWF